MRQEVGAQQEGLDRIYLMFQIYVSGVPAVAQRKWIWLASNEDTSSIPDLAQRVKDLEEILYEAIVIVQGEKKGLN